MKFRFLITFIICSVILCSCNIKKINNKDNYQTATEVKIDEIKGNKTDATYEVESVINIEALAGDTNRNNRYFTDNDNQIEEFFKIKNSINYNEITDDAFSVGRDKYDILINYDNKTDSIKIGSGYIKLDGRFYYITEDEYDKIEKTILSWNFEKVQYSNPIINIDVKGIKSIEYIDSVNDVFLNKEDFDDITDVLKKTDFTYVEDDIETYSDSKKIVINSEKESIDIVFTKCYYCINDVYYSVDISDYEDLNNIIEHGYCK